MKTKSLKQITGQVSRINSQLANHKMTKTEEARFHRVHELGRRYGANIVDYLRKQMGPADLNEYGAKVAIPASIYTK